MNHVFSLFYKYTAKSKTFQPVGVAVIQLDLTFLVDSVIIKYYL